MIAPFGLIDRKPGSVLYSAASSAPRANAQKGPRS
jgi:hypothetical protein